MKGEIPRFQDPGVTNRAQKLLLLAVGYGLVALFLFAAGARYAAHRAAQTIDRAHLERALRLDPLNADYHARIGHWYLFGENDARAAARAYEQAAHLNPNEARYWLALSTARLQLSDATGEFEAIRNAAAAAPTTPDIAWQTGMHLIVNGHDAEALQTFRKLLESAPKEIERVASLCWRALHDSDRIVREALPRNPDAYLTFQRVLIAAGAFDDADKVWTATVALKQPIPQQAALLYVDDLLTRQKVETAAATWSYLVEHDASFRKYRDDDNLVMNGTFDQPLLNDAFDWRFPSYGPVEFSLDSNETKRGSGSLQLKFEGDMVGDTNFFQFVPVSPDTEYTLRATVKAAELVSATPLRFHMTDAVTGELFGAPNGVMGTTGDWIALTGKVRTGVKSHLLKVGVSHAQAGHVAGKMWIDSVELKRAGADGSSR